MDKVCSIMKRISILLAILSIYSCAPKCFEVGESRTIVGLHAPWDGLDDLTKVHCYADSSSFYFLYEVEDSTLCLVEPFTKERDVDFEDRIEIFFSPRKAMDVYYCAEIDPNGHIMDYKAHSYRDFNYDWKFESLKTYTCITDKGYIVGGHLSLQELRELGIDLNHFFMGVFRADFKPGGEKENWYSFIPTSDAEPDFHIPEVLFSVSLK